MPASLFYRFFENNNGWTLPVLFAILRDLRDLALDVWFSPFAYLSTRLSMLGRS